MVAGVGIILIMDKLQKLIKKYGWKTAMIIVAASFLIAALTSCNVTRTVTTTSQVYQRGDTTTTIISKTIESYDAQKK